ncbi:MAG: DUF3391 domain-containing protein [Sulfuriferula sp.]|nr:DUF3391 domain-containing protein [Sulfuriferula sp.]
MNKDNTRLIDIADLQIGLYVFLDLGWMQHPFPLNHFKIQHQSQIDTIRSLGVRKVRYAPDKSDIDLDGTCSASTKPIASAAAEQPVLDKKQQHKAMLNQQRAQLLSCDRRFNEALGIYKDIVDQITQQPQSCLKNAEKLIAEFINDFLGQDEVSIRLLSENHGEKNMLHSLNVTILSMLLAKASGMDAPQIQDIGVAALLHDIGKIMLPNRIRWHDEHFTPAENNLYETHVAHSLTLAKQMGCSSVIQQIIAQHHEYADGSGFPLRSTEKDIPLPSQIVSLINTYDHLCNPSNPSAAVTPHEALSFIFAKLRPKFNTGTISRFVHMMGVYPPGSVIQLSDQRYALVITVNSSRPLKPKVLIYDASIPSDEALIVDLEAHPEIGIQRSLKPLQLPKIVFDYLSPRKRACYFFERGRSIETAALSS